MNTANMVLRKKSLPPRHCNRGNILLFAMGMTVLASCFILSYQNQVSSLRNHLHLNKKLQQEKQALNLARFAFNKLKSIATDDFIATCIKKEKLHFYNVQTESPQDLGAIEVHFDEYKMGVTVQANEELSDTICCRFQETGLRKAINECFSEIPHRAKEQIKLRWENFQTNDYLKAPLFFPLVNELEINDNVKVTLYNPFDRNLQGTTSIEIQWYERQMQDTEAEIVTTVPENIEKSISINLASKSTSSTTENLPKDFTVNKIIVGDLVFEEIETHGKYQVDYPKLDEPFQYKLKKQAVTTTRMPGRWGRRAPAATSVETSPPNSHELPFFETKNWIQCLNACCFFGEKGKPYRIIDNFELTNTDSIALRDFFWNNTVADPQALAFNFNGSEQYLKKRLEEMRLFISEENLKQILLHQPYPNAVAFLKQIFNDKLYLFKNLTHRTECFSIQSYCEDIKCTMIVYRTLGDNAKRIWKVQNIQLTMEKSHW